MTHTEYVLTLLEERRGADARAYLDIHKLHLTELLREALELLEQFQGATRESERVSDLPEDDEAVWVALGEEDRAERAYLSALHKLQRIAGGAQ